MIEGILLVFVRTFNITYAAPWIHLYKGKIYSEYTIDRNGSPIRTNGYHTYLIPGEEPKFVFYDAKGYREGYQKIFKEPGVKIGIFGDSYTEGLQVDEEKTFPALLEAKLNGALPGKVHVFNFGWGMTGTYNQYMRYLTVKDDVKLDYVVLAFLPLNDVYAKHFNDPNYLPDASYMDYVNGEFVEVHPAPRNNVFRNMYHWVKNRSYALTLLSRVAAKINQKVLANKKEVSMEGPSRLFWLSSFGPPPNQDWEESWMIIEETVKRMNAAVEAEGSKFVFIILTSGLQVEAVSDEYDYRYPNNRMSAFARADHIDYIDTYDIFMEKRKALQAPYFSFKNDGHYSEVGTQLVSDILKDYFLSHGLGAAN